LDFLVPENRLFGVNAAFIQASVFEADVVVVVNVVDADNFVSAFEEAEHGVVADESGATGDEDFHG
jgi:hypothetical protein